MSQEHSSLGRGASRLKLVAALDAPEASLNIQGARLELISDLAGSVGVLAAALIIRLSGWPLAEPLFAVAIGLFILPRAWRLGRESVRILVQAAPLDDRR